MPIDMDFGLSVIDNMITRALENEKCDKIDCMAYNVSLDYVLELFEKFNSLSQFNIYSNSEQINFSEKNKSKIIKMNEETKINFFHLPIDEQTLHAKAYRFWKNGKIVFTAFGSPNFSRTSNQSFEVLLYLKEEDVSKNIWEEFEQLCNIFDYNLDKKIPENIIKAVIEKDEALDKYLDDLWKHQIFILRWFVGRQNGIVNIPPGTGKTEIALTRIKYLFEKENNSTVIILVPTKILIKQWKDRLDKFDIKKHFVLDTKVEGEVEAYFNRPAQKVLITLYSRFFDLYNEYFDLIKVNKPNLIIISDESQNWYNHLDILEKFHQLTSDIGIKSFHIDMSATIETFNKEEMKKYINLLGGEQNRYEITLPVFYSKWNNLNSRPILKPIRYLPIRYNLTDSEMKEYNKLTRNVIIEFSQKNIIDKEKYGAAIRRALWVRNLNGGINNLKDFINSHIEKFNKSSSIIFVETNEIAEDIRDFITSHPGWDKQSSAYVYDSEHSEKYKEYAMEQFKKNKGFSLVSEQMLKEGFDLPKISIVVLEGSFKTPRDWLQKIGRAIRYDLDEPDSVAEIVDIVFCKPDGTPLDIEIDRYETLRSISV